MFRKVWCIRLIKKINTYLCIFSLLFTFLTKDVKAYEYVESLPHFVCNIPNLGEVSLYIPTDKIDYIFITEKGSLSNSSSSSITLYSSLGDEYTFNLPSFGNLRYRQTNFSGQYIELSDYEIVKTSNFLDVNNDFHIIIDNYELILCFIMSLGLFVFITIWLRGS